MSRARMAVGPSVDLPAHLRDDQSDSAGEETRLDLVPEERMSPRPSRRIRRPERITDELHERICKVARLFIAAQTERIRLGNKIRDLIDEGVDDAIIESFRLAERAQRLEESMREKSLVRVMRTHPLAPFVKEKAPGLGLVDFGKLLSVTGRLDNFATVSKLWAFLGQHVVDGRAPRRRRGVKSKWSDDGKTFCHQIGVRIVMCQKGKYNALYYAKREVYFARTGVGLSGCPFGWLHMRYVRSKDPVTGWNRKTGGDKIVQCVTVDEKGEKHSPHVHKASMRISVKELLKDLWLAWRALSLRKGDTQSSAAERRASAGSVAKKRGSHGPTKSRLKPKGTMSAPCDPSPGSGAT